MPKPAAIGLATLLSATAAFAQGYEERCLPENDTGNGLALAVDGRGRVHLSRAYRLGGGHLHHTVIDGRDAPVETIVAERVNLLGTDEVSETDILLGPDGLANICSYDAGNQRFQVMVQEAAGWRRETVVEGLHAGDACSLGWLGDQLTVAFHHDERLFFATREGPDSWRVEVVDAVPNADVGVAVDLSIINGVPIMAHRDDTNARLRVSWRRADGAWQTVVPPGQDALAAPAGGAPQIVPNGEGGVWIIHSFVVEALSDNALLLTSGPLDNLRTQILIQEEVGGSFQAINANGQLQVATRYLLRSPIFGNYDGLRIYDDLSEVLDFESARDGGPADGRHTYQRVSLAVDPFGLSVVAAFDEASAFRDEPGYGKVCIWTPTDRDHDGLPDAVEAHYGADPDDPDTDNDGRLDGAEVLAGDDPSSAGALPDAGLPEDAGVLEDFGVVEDAGVLEDATVVEDVGPAHDADTEDADTEDADTEDADTEDADLTDATSAPDQGVTDDAAIEADGARPVEDGAMPSDSGPDPDASWWAPDYGDEPAVTPDPGGGCTSAPGQTPKGPWLLTMLGMMGAALRRRRA